MALRPPSVLSNLRPFPEWFYTNFTPGEVLQRSPRLVVLATGKDGRSVAVKRTPLPQFQEEEVYLPQRLLAAGAVAVAPVQEITRDNDYVYLESPFFVGGDLLNSLKHDEPLSENDALHKLLPVVKALATMHQQGMVHLDVKPENIFLSSRTGSAAELKLADFGSARVFVGDGVKLEQQQQGACGTPNYVAPEVVDERVWASPAADVYSVGMTLYTMLLRRPMTHPGKTPLDTCLRQRRALAADEVPFGNVSADLVSLLRETVSFDPRDRPSMQKLHSRLAGLLLQSGLRNDSALVARVRSVQQVAALSDDGGLNTGA